MTTSRFILIRRSWERGFTREAVPAWFAWSSGRIEENDENRMTNDERIPNVEIRNAVLPRQFRGSGLLRHSDFRHRPLLRGMHSRPSNPAQLKLASFASAIRQSCRE